MAKIIVNNPRQVINGGAKKYYFKVKGLGGPKGDQGDKGDTGATGPQGPQGNAATVSVGSTTTLPVGYDATVTNTGSIYNAVLDFGIPQGPQGPQGAKGDKGDTGAKGDTGPRGPQGEKGTNATVYIGTTSTLNPGTQATVYNSGTDSNAVLNFGIPRGEKGETGATGATGATGPAGQNFTPTIVDSLPATGNQSNLYLTPKNYTTGTATGNPITISIGEDAGQVTSAQLDGDTTQQTYTGENLYQSIGVSEASGGITSELQPDGKLRIHGQASSSSSNFTGTMATTLPAGTYTFSITKTMPYRVLLRASNNQNIGVINAGDTSATFTTTETLTSIWVWGYQLVSGTDYDDTVGFQLEAGSTARQFEPYCGGTASPNPDYPQSVNTVTGTQTVEVVGKNLLDQGAYTSSSIRGASVTFNQDKIVVSGTVDSTHYPSWIMYADGSTATSDWWATASLVNTSKGQFTDSGAYTISIEADGNIGSISIPTSFEFIVGYMDGTISTNKYVDQTTKKATFTTSKPINYISFGFRPTVSYDATFTIQLEAGDTATSFAPYNKQTLPIDLGSIELCKLGDYQDYIYKDGESWKVHKATGVKNYTGERSENWSYFSFNGYTLWRSTDVPVNMQSSAITTGSFKSNNFTYWVNDGTSVSAGVTEGLFGFNAATTNINFKYASLEPTLRNWTTWLSTHNTSVYYPLATATDTTITDQTLIAQLEAVRNATLQASNTITNTAAGSNLAGDLELGYYEYDPHNRYNKWLWLDINNNYEQLGS